MPVKNPNLQKVTLNLNRSDYRRLAELHPQSGAAEIIRAIISAYIFAIESKSTIMLEEIENLP